VEVERKLSYGCEAGREFLFCSKILSIIAFYFTIFSTQGKMIFFTGGDCLPSKLPVIAIFPRVTPLSDDE